MAQSSAKWGWTGTSYGEYIYLKAEVEKQEIANNRTQFKVEIWNNSSNSFGDTGSISYTVKDQWATRVTNSLSDRGTNGYNQTKDYATHYFWINHNDDGSLPNVNFVLSITRALGNTRSATVNVTVSGVPSIPRASSIKSLTGTTLGDNHVVTIDRKATFTHDVWYKINDQAYQKVGTKVATSVTFSTKVSESSFIPNSAKGTITIRIQTYNGNAAVGGYVTTSKEINVPTSVKPTIDDLEVTEYTQAVLDLVLPAQTYVQGVSRLNVAIVGASGVYGSTIKSYKIKVDDQQANTQTGTTLELTSSGNITVKATVTDSRGRESEEFQVPITVLPYERPRITNISFNRSDSEGAIDLWGDHATLKLDATISDLDGKNQGWWTLELADENDSHWTPMIGYQNKITTIHADIDQTKTYQFRFKIKDKLNENHYETDTFFIRVGGANFFVGYQGLPSTFGKIPTHGKRYNAEVGDKGIISDGGFFDKDENELTAVKGRDAKTGYSATDFTYSSSTPLDIPWLDELTLEVSKDNATILFSASAVIRTSTKTSSIAVFLDDEITTARGVTNLTTDSEVTVSGMFENVSKGTHTVQLKVYSQDNTATITLPRYRSASVVAWEV